MGPWNTEEISQARQVPFLKVLDIIGAYYKRDLEYEPLDCWRRPKTDNLSGCLPV